MNRVGIVESSVPLAKYLLDDKENKKRNTVYIINLKKDEDFSF